nr:PREDICTED: calcium-binding and coiled-coil domain-containing protein 1 [Latimeria chalumnae]|eukprot:XP_014349328.1 PREDICTED: calcium-binding and coiled-coil domain-containing protein 1 [Latimeria chalumnae]
MEGQQVSVSQAVSQSKVMFHNVARSYIPSTKLECHYTLSPGMKWSTRDWIGIFKVGWSSMRDYYTFEWSVVPDSYKEGASMNCYVQFQGLKRPGQLGQCEKEKEELLTLKLQLEAEVKGLQEEIEKLTTSLQAAQEEQVKVAEQCKELLKARELVSAERDSLIHQRADSIARILELEEDIKVINRKVLEKETELDRMKDRVKKLVSQQEQLGKQLREEAEDKERYQAKFKALEQENRKLSYDLQATRGTLGEKEKQILQLREEISKVQQKLSTAQEKRGQVELLCEQLRSIQDQLAASQQKVVLMGEELASASSIRDRTMSDLHKSRLEVAELNIKLADMTLKWKETKAQWLKEKAMILESSEAEKEKVLKLSTEVLKLESGLQEEISEKANLKVELSMERDSSKVQLSESRRELKESKSALWVAQKEKEQLQEEKRELLEYIKLLEQRLDKVADSKWSETVRADTPDGQDSPLSDSEDEAPEDMRARAQLSPYGLCDNRVAAEMLVLSTPPLSPRELAQEVVISQPVPISSQIKQLSEEENTSDSEAEDDKDTLMVLAQGTGEETTLLLPELGHAFQYTVSSDDDSRQNSAEGRYDCVQRDRAAGSGLWKECPICKERFPLEFDRDALEEHIDSHFFFSTHDPFTFE